jgi:hypothetical protein
MGHQSRILLPNWLMNCHAAMLISFDEFLPWADAEDDGRVAHVADVDFAAADERDGGSGACGAGEAGRGLGPLF